MNKTQLMRNLNGIKEDYKKIVKLEEFKQLKKDLKVIDDFTTTITQDDDTTTKTQKISINKNMINNFKALASKICNADTNAIIEKASNNQIKKAFALAIFDNTRNDLKLAIRTNTTKLYNYQDITKVFATFKATIENLKTQNKKLSIVVDIATDNLKLVDADAIYNKLLEEKAQQRKNAQLARKNKKAIENEKATKKS